MIAGQPQLDRLTAPLNIGKRVGERLVRILVGPEPAGAVNGNAARKPAKCGIERYLDGLRVKIPGGDINRSDRNIPRPTPQSV